VAEELERFGYKNVHPLYGGFNAWQQANGPLEPKSIGEKANAT
jgi:3-mercaptopyruvate sulfurtransferase SseA